MEKEEGEDKVSRRQRYWIKDLSLYASDRQSIKNGEWLTDAVINSAQTLLREQYPLIGGLQMTTLGHTLSYAIEKGEFVQVLNIRGSHWLTISNIGCKPNLINIYDSIPYGDISTRAKQQICALVFSDAAEITQLFKCAVTNRGGSDCGLYAIAFAMHFSLHRI